MSNVGLTVSTCFCKSNSEYNGCHQIRFPRLFPCSLNLLRLILLITTFISLRMCKKTKHYVYACHMCFLYAYKSISIQMSHLLIHAHCLNTYINMVHSFLTNTKELIVMYKHSAAKPPKRQKQNA